MPVATRNGLAALSGFAALTLGAGLTGHAILAVAASIAGALLLASYATLALLLFELKRRALEFTWGVAGGAEARAGGHVDLEIRFCNRSVFGWRGVAVELVGPSTISLDPVEIDLPRRSAVRASLRVRTLRAGLWVAWGATLRFRDAAGLFRVAPYCPRHLPIRVRPAPATTMRVQPSRAAAEGGTRARRQPGMGTDLREIRELRHGDPFRRIAWKASARLGRLMVREFEAEVRVPVMLAVDVGPSMREGPVGGAALDQAVRAAYAFAESTLADGDPVGLATFSRRCLSFFAPRLEPGQLRRIEDALLDAVVDVATPDVLDGRMGLLRAAAGYLVREAGLRVSADLANPGDDVLVDVGVVRILDRLRREGRVASIPTDEEERLRLFARVHGLELPPAPRDAWQGREEGIVEVVERAVREARGKLLLLLVSDLEGMADTAALGRAFARARSRLAVAAVVPARRGPAPAPGRRGRRAAADETLRELARARRRRGAIGLLSRVGAPVLVAAPGEDLRGLLVRAASCREAIRKAS